MRTEVKWGMAVLVLLVMAIGVGIFCENVRGAKRLEEIVAKARAEGIPADEPISVESRISEEDNFFHGPLIGSLSEFRLTGSVFDGTNEVVFSDPAAIAELNSLNLRMSPGSYGMPSAGTAGLTRGELADLEWWAAIFRALPEFTVTQTEAGFAEQCLEAIDSRFGVQLAKLDQAAARPYAELPLFRSDGKSYIPGRSSMVTWSSQMFVRLLMFRYLVAVEAGNWQEALQSFDRALVFIKGVQQQQQVISSLVSDTQVSMTTGTIWHGLVKRQLDEMALIDLQRRLRSIQFADSVASGFAGEIRDVHENFLRINEDYRTGVWLHGYGVPVRSDVFVQMLRWAPSGWIDLNASTVMEVVLNEGYLPWSDLDFSNLATADSRIDARDRLDTVFVSHFLGPRSDLSVRLASTYIGLEQTIIACALERFRLQNGRHPKRLSELVPDFLEEIPVDPFDGNPMRYRREDDQFVIYSVGPNGSDDGGYVSRGRRNRPNYFNGDIAWSFETWIDEKQALKREEAMFRMSLEEKEGRSLSHAEFSEAWDEKLMRESGQIPLSPTEQEKRQALLIKKAYERVEADRVK